MKITLRQYWALLVTHLRPQWPQAIGLALLLLTSIGLELLNPQILSFFIDTANAGGALPILTRTALLFLGVALAIQLVSVAEMYVATNIGLIATNRLRADLTLHCLRLDPSFHNEHTPGELIERVDGDVARLGNFFSRFVVHLLGNALLLIGILMLLFRIDWRAGLSLTFLALIALGVVNSLRDIAIPFWEAARQASANLFGFIEERLSGTEDIRASGATAYVMRQLYERSRVLLRTDLKASLVSMGTGGATIILFAVSTAVGLGLGAYLYQAGAITLGAVYLIFNYTMLLSRPIEQITRQMQDLQQAAASLTRIQKLLTIQSAIKDGPIASLPAGPLSVEFQNVSFSYDSAGPVLKNISLTLPPGASLGLLGRTGSGKTTLTRLSFRLYDPTQGAIRLGGVDLRELHLAEIRNKVGMVTQDIQLFHAPVRDNLTFFDADISDEQILRVLAELGLGDWYQTLPAGLDTKLAAGGGGLSAGQAQLLAFARVFLKNPSVVILDEASSRLDPATEQRLEQAMGRLLEDRTAIIIAHRLGTVQRADTILILEEGQIGEYGARDQLLHDPNSRFSQLLQTGLAEALA